MSDYPMLISNKLHSFRNFYMQKLLKYQVPLELRHSLLLIENKCLRSSIKTITTNLECIFENHIYKIFSIYPASYNR